MNGRQAWYRNDWKNTRKVKLDSARKLRKKFKRDIYNFDSVQQIIALKSKAECFLHKVNGRQAWYRNDWKNTRKVKLDSARNCL